MKFKDIFNDSLGWNEEQQKYERKIRAALSPVFKEFCDEGYFPRDFQLMVSSFDVEIAAHCLKTAMKINHKRRVDEKRESFFEILKEINEEYSHVASPFACQKHKDWNKLVLYSKDCPELLLEMITEDLCYVHELWGLVHIHYKEKLPKFDQMSMDNSIKILKNFLSCEVSKGLK